MWYKDLGATLFVLGVWLLGMTEAVPALEIYIHDAGKAVSTREYTLRTSVSAALPIKHIRVELNGVELANSDFSPQVQLEQEYPVLLDLGPNLVRVQAGHKNERSSQLATIIYYEGDDMRGPTLRITEPTLAARQTVDSTIVVRGYAFDDVKVDQVKIAGYPALAWEGAPPLDEANLASGGWNHMVAFESPPLPLVEGTNTLLVRAMDQREQNVKKTVEVFRRPQDRGDRWAVVVGISEYLAGEHKPDYADDDARAFYEFLLNPRGGNFDSEKTRLLLNENATSTALRQALEDFLTQTKQDDLVIIYFAGHGKTEIGRNEIIYLLTYDTVPQSLVNSAISLREIDDTLRNMVLAERILILADACHSGAYMAMPVANASGKEENGFVHQYFQELSTTVPGATVFTASRGQEEAQEGTQWGEGHGVFTYHLLQALKGEGDRNKNGIVTLGEVIEYTGERVQEDTRGGQHPDVGGTYDPNLPLSVLRTPE